MAARPRDKKAIIGFDGFVDEIVHVVDKRIDSGNFVRLTSMAEYGERIKKSAGLSTNVEMITTQQKLGGNGPIFANALIEYGMDLTYIGALGVPDIHPVFRDMTARCHAIALSNPSFTDAIEFFDGKIISSKLQNFNAVTWDSLMEKAGLPAFIKLLDESDLIGFENWTMVPHMGDIWKHILNDAMPKMRPREVKPVLFIDLADPEKRSAEDVLEALTLISRFSKYCRVIFGLNKKEACEVAEVLGMRVPDYDAQDLRQLAEFIYSKMDISALVLHPVKEACAIEKDGFYRVTGPYCERPKLTTGAGDNFNAGFILGVTLGFGLTDALTLGVATSGYYVRYAKSPGLADMDAFLKDWAQGGI